MKLASLLNHISVGAEFVGVEFGPRIYGGRVCEGPSLLGAEMSRNLLCLKAVTEPNSAEPTELTEYILF